MSRPPIIAPTSQRWDREHDQYGLTGFIELIEPEFEPTTWNPFRGVVIESRKPADVAADLGISPNAVLLAKSRILKRLREESKGLLDYEVVSLFQTKRPQGFRSKDLLNQLG
jgi:RNA polymerase sigma-70 factor (ECF subfamily)